MRILVQDAVRDVYFDGVDWNENVAQAETCCHEHELFTALIVVKSNDGRHDISYPVGDRNALLVSKPATTEIKSLY
jgi:hypothetical protein